VESVSEKNNFIYLIVSLVVLLLAGALVDQFPGSLGQHIFQAASVVTLALSTFGFRSTQLRLQTGVGFTLSVLAIVILGVLLDEAGMSSMHLFVLILFYCWATWHAAKQVLFSGPIDGNKIVGAICIYLLIGLIWALLYLYIAQSIPNAFNGLEQRVWYDNFANVAYFSFVTLTTLGYGDISPIVPIARFLVYMEAIVGVFYMAILVASLIGIRISSLHSDRD
jgi:voltage-gated potassium channel